MMKLPELKKIAKENGIRHSYYNKLDLLELLREKGLIREENTYSGDYSYLLYNCKHPEQTQITDLITGEVRVYPSIYMASRVLVIGNSTLARKDGKVFQQRYKIDILE